MPTKQKLSYSDNYILDQVMELYRKSRDEHERVNCAPWFIFYKHYKNIVERIIDPDSGHTNIGIGLGFSMVEVMHGQVMGPWTSGDEIINAAPLDPIAEEFYWKIESFVNEQIVNKVARAFGKMSVAMKSGLLFGRGIIKPYVRTFPEKSIMKRVEASYDFFGQAIPMGNFWKMVDMPVSKKLWFDYVDPFDFWFLGSRWFEDADCTFERSYVTRAEAAQRINSGEWAGVDLDEMAPIMPDEYRTKRLSLEASGMASLGRQYLQPHHLIEFQGLIETKASKGSKPKYESKLIQILNENFLVKNEPLTSWDARPGYVVWEPICDPASDRPIGMVEPVEDLILYQNDLMNIALDNARKILESPLLASISEFPDRSVKLGAAAINWVRNPMTAARPLEMKDLPGSFYQMIGFLNDLIQRISGQNDMMGGLNTSDTERLTKTATGMSLMANLATTRFAPFLTSMDRDFYRPLARWFFETARQRMTGSEKIKVWGYADAAFTTVGPEDLKGEFEFSFNVKSLDPSRQVKRTEFVELFQTIAAPEVAMRLAEQGYKIDLYELIKILMREFDRAKDIDKIISEMPTLPVLPGQAPMPGPGEMTVPGRPEMLPEMAPGVPPQ